MPFPQPSPDPIALSSKDGSGRSDDRNGKIAVPSLPRLPEREPDDERQAEEQTPMVRNILSALMLAIAVVAAATTQAHAWGANGHRLIGDLTYERLTPEGRRLVDRLIATAPGQEGFERCPTRSLADASVWADCVRGERMASFGYMSQLHYVSTPICQAEPTGSFCPDGDCVTEAVRQAEAVLADDGATDLSRLLALQHLAHFLQDMHQPLHVGQNDDRGGNEVTITTFEGGRSRNLHSLWDGDLVTATVGSQREQLAALRAEIDARGAGWTGQTIETWGLESFRWSRDQAYRALPTPPGCSQAPADGGQITAEYVDRARPIVREQLAKAVVRLTEVIDRAARAS